MRVTLGMEKDRGDSGAGRVESTRTAELVIAAVSAMGKALAGF